MANKTILHQKKSSAEITKKTTKKKNDLEIKRTIDYIKQRNIRQWRSMLIRHARKAKNITQDEMADRLKIFQSAYSTLENKGTDSKYLKEVAEIIGVPYDLLHEPTVPAIQEYIKRTSKKKVKNTEDNDETIIMIMTVGEIDTLLDGLGLLLTQYNGFEYNKDKADKVSDLYSKLMTMVSP